MIKTENICKEMNTEENICLFEGTVSVRAVINAGKRKIAKVYVPEHKKQKRDRKTLSFISFLKEKNIPFELISKAETEKIIKKYSSSFVGNTHGGVIALAEERQYEDCEKMLSTAKNGEYFVYLDGVEDPFNLGYSVRTMYAMGCNGFILSMRSWENASGAITRSSAGAWELADVCFSQNDVSIVELCKKSDMPIVCSALSKTSVPITDFKPNKPFLLVIGGEKRGISPEFMDNAEKIVHIPYMRSDVKYSLPTASVCAMYAEALIPYAKQISEVEVKCSDM